MYVALEAHTQVFGHRRFPLRSDFLIVCGWPGGFSASAVPEGPSARAPDTMFRSVFTGMRIACGLFVALALVELRGCFMEQHCWVGAACKCAFGGAHRAQHVLTRS